MIGKTKPDYLFDLGGVVALAVPNGVSVPVIYSIAARYRVDGEKLREALWKKDRQFKSGLITEDQYLTSTLKGMGRYLRDGDTAYDLLYQPLGQVIFEDKKMTAVLTELGKRHRLFVLSNITRPQLAYARSVGLVRLFDFVFASCEIGLVKPDPRIYQYVLDKIGSNAPDVVFVDNKSENLSAASALGMRTILFTDADNIAHKLSTFQNLK